MIRHLNRLWEMIGQAYQESFRRSINHPQVFQACQKLWQIFNTDRSQLKKFLLSEPPMAGSYALMFWIPNIIRSASALRWAPPFDKNHETWLDLGCGPWSASCGQLLRVLEHSSTSQSIEILGYDHSPRLPEFAKDIIQSWWADIQNPNLTHNLALKFKKTTLGERNHFKTPQVDRLFLTNVLNEVPMAPAKLLSQTDATTCLLLEPAKPHIFKKLLEGRAALVKHGYHVWAPCTHSCECPLRNLRGEWCYEHVPLPENLHWVHWSRELFGRRADRHVHYGYVVSSKIPPARNAGFQVISDSVPTRSSPGMYVCSAQGRDFLKGSRPSWGRGTRVSPR